MRRWAPLVVMALSTQPDAPRTADALLHRPPGVGRISIVDPATYWTSRGFAHMTPPIRLPSRDGKELIVVWLHVPDASRIGVARRADGSPTLIYPDGTIADRADMTDGSSARTVTDVRGTRFANDIEMFHVLRPLDPAGLRGVEWARGDADAQRAATTEMLSQMRFPSRASGTPATDPGLALFASQNDCAWCHVHDKPERRRIRPEPASVDPPPNRGTDEGGLYTVASVLEDTAPLETHRALDMNEGDPYVTTTCADGSAAELAVGRGGRTRHFRCEDQSVPRARLDLPRAIADGDGHAAEVCRSRGYLFDHMTREGREAFALAFAICGLTGER
jgi:hypothetical protein